MLIITRKVHRHGALGSAVDIGPLTVTLTALDSHAAVFSVSSLSTATVEHIVPIDGECQIAPDVSIVPMSSGHRRWSLRMGIISPDEMRILRDDAKKRHAA